MTRRARVLCLGHAAHDLIYRVPSIPARPLKVLATSFSECGGGMAANAAVAIARLDGDVEYWGRVADDTLGHRILGELEAEGVDVRSARFLDGRSPCTSILVSDLGERLICSFTDPTLDDDPGWLPLERIPSFDVVLADVRWPRGAARLLDAARAVHRPALLDADVASPEVIADLSECASHVLFSEAGLAVLAGDRAPGAALRSAGLEATRVVGVTLGAEGFLWLENGVEHHLPAPPIVPVDTLAAGDIWHGAFALALAEGRPVAGAAAFANTAAAIKCQRPGGRKGAPTRAEVEAILSVQRQ
jgi:sulfofructose kinase